MNKLNKLNLVQINWGHSELKSENEFSSSWFNQQKLFVSKTYLLLKTICNFVRAKFACIRKNEAVIFGFTISHFWMWHFLWALEFSSSYSFETESLALSSVFPFFGYFTLFYQVGTGDWWIISQFFLCIIKLKFYRCAFFNLETAYCLFPTSTSQSSTVSGPLNKLKYGNKKLILVVISSMSFKLFSWMDASAEGINTVVNVLV